MRAVDGRPLVLVCDWRGFDEPHNALGPRERRYAADLRGGRQREWIRARLTVKAALGWGTGTAGAEVLPDGAGAPRPSVDGVAVPVTVSLSHTGAAIACVVGAGHPAGPYGVDVERVDAGNDILLRRLLAPGDREAIRAVPERLFSTFLVSCKEAAFKAYGGRSARLRDYRLSRRRDGQLWVRPAQDRAPELRIWARLSGELVVVCAAPDVPPFWRRVAPADVLATIDRAGAPRHA